MTNRTVGEAIKEIRLEQKSSQNAFAKKIGISRTYLSDLENNRKSPSLETIQKIADKIGVSLTSLVESHDEFEKNERQLLEEQYQEALATIANDSKLTKTVKDYLKSAEMSNQIDFFSEVDESIIEIINFFNDLTGEYPDGYNYSENFLKFAGSLLSLLADTYSFAEFRNDDTLNLDKYKKKYAAEIFQILDILSK